MRRLYFCLFLLLLSGISLHAQQPQQDTLPVRIQPYVFKEFVVLGPYGFAALLVNDQKNPSDLLFRLFDVSGKEIGEKRIDLQRRELLSQLEGIFYWNDRLCIVSSLFYPGPKRNHLMFYQYSLPEMELVSSTLIDEAYTPEAYRIPFGFSLSPDSSKVAFYSWSYALPKDPAKLTVHVYDREVRKIWSQYYFLPYKNETFYVYGCLAKDDGGVFVLCENYEGRVPENGAINLNRIKYFVLYMEPGTKDILEYEPDLDDNTITSIRYTMDSGNNLLGAGFFKGKNKINNEGVFSIRIDGKTKEIKAKMSQISREEFEGSFGYGEKETAPSALRKRFAEFQLNQVIALPDGGFWLVAEQFSDNFEDFPPLQFNDILVGRIDSELRLGKIVRIPKWQRGFWVDAPLYSYSTFQHGEELLILFNDNALNHRENRNRNSIRSYQRENTVSVLARIDGAGRLSTSEISSRIPKSSNVNFLPKYCMKIPGDLLLLYGEGLSDTGASTGMFFTIGLEQLQQ